MRISQDIVLSIVKVILSTMATLATIVMFAIFAVEFDTVLITTIFAVPIISNLKVSL